MTSSTIKEYGIYQGKNFREALSDDSRRSDKKKAKKTRPRPPVRLAEVNDLTVPEQNYREHLSELHKLPPFMRICSAQNMLTYCGQQHTKAQLLLSVPSCRVPPRHSVFAKVSLNVGPGDYEWFIGKSRSWPSSQHNYFKIKCLNGGMSSSAIYFHSKARHFRTAGGQISKLALNIPYLFIDLYR